MAVNIDRLLINTIAYLQFFHRSAGKVISIKVFETFSTVWSKIFSQFLLIFIWAQLFPIRAKVPNFLEFIELFKFCMNFLKKLSNQNEKLQILL